MRGMRVLFVAPYPLAVPGGNSTAVVRLMAQLGELLGPEFEAHAVT